MKKSEIWLAELPSGKGHEQKGVRPCIIMGKIYGLACILPLTSSCNRATMGFTELIEQTPSNGLSNDSVALLFQLTTISEERLIKKIGAITDQQQNTIDTQLKNMLKIK
jgi:mRNA interferase MazF